MTADFDYLQGNHSKKAIHIPQPDISAREIIYIQRQPKTK
jgi:hypothetical protein